MRESDFDPERGLELLAELIRLTAPPAGEAEICQQAAELTARALRGAGAAVFLGQDPGSLDPVASSGEADPSALAVVGGLVLRGPEAVEETEPGRPLPSRVALPLLGPSGVLGALVLVGPSSWTPASRTFARGAARVIANSLAATRTITSSHRQGEALARRNVELETVRELAATLQEMSGEEEMLQRALDLVLGNLGLESGWIFWGETSRGELELAAARGVATGFVEHARENGIGTCLCRDVFNSGRLMMARNTMECPRLPHLARATSHACVPLKFERGTLGVMNIANRPGQILTTEELGFLETIARQICIAVDKARTARAEGRRNAEARALVSLARAIGGSLERERVLAAVGDYARELLAADRCAIFLGDDPSAARFAYLSGPAMDGIAPGETVDFLALRSRLLVEAFAQRQRIVIQNALDDPRVNRELAVRWGLHSMIVVPLVVRGRMEGVVQVSRSSASSWDAQDVALADALAGQAAVAIENSRLYGEVQEALVRLQHAQSGMLRAERLAAVGTLASSLAHEVRNPLNSVNLQLVLLSRRVAKLEESLRGEMPGLIQSAQLEIARLDGLVEEFLSLSSVDRLVLAETDPAEVVRELMVLMTPAARESGIAIEQQLDASLPKVLLDREKIKQVLINVVRNAIEAMPSGGTLGVSTGVTDGSVVIRVSDTGTGIEPGLDVFDFFMTTKRDGTGLGLAISRRIMEAHGGTISYASEPGAGTVFEVFLKVS